MNLKVAAEKAPVQDDALLQIRGLRIEALGKHGNHDIVRGVDLNLCRGEVLGLVEESGAGKSTIGLAAMGYARPGCRIVSGSVRFNGQDLLTLARTERRK